MSGLWDRTQAKFIVVHYLGDGLPPVTSEAELKHQANSGPWEYPDYDFGILADGTVISMRPLSVVGAHTVADRAKYEYGDNWWNKNSASIVLGYGDAKTGPTQAQVTALAKFLIDWCGSKGTTFDTIYPHFQVTMTDCPGAKSTQCGLDTGLLDWDSVEAAVRGKDATLAKVLPGAVVVANPVGAAPGEKVVVFFGEDDRPGAVRVASKVGASILVLREEYQEKPGDQIYVCGGDPIEGSAGDFSGATWEESTGKVLDFLRG